MAPKMGARKKIGDHFVKDCPEKCPDCGLGYCPGAQSMACAVSFDVAPVKRDLKNALGRPLPDFLVEKLQKAWQSKHPNGEVSSLERECCSECSDDDEPVSTFVGPCGGLWNPGK